MAYLFYHNKRNARLELIMKDGAPFPADESRTDWYVQRSCLNVALALAAEVEHFGFVRREIPPSAPSAPLTDRHASRTARRPSPLSFGKSGAIGH
jgi:hypothetical protein